MARPILYTLLFLTLLTVVSSCHRQMARVQPSLSDQYSSVVVADKVETIPLADELNPSQVVANAAGAIEQTSSVALERKSATKPTIDQKTALSKRMVRIQKQLLTSSAIGNKTAFTSPQTKGKRITEDSNGTLGLLGLIFGASSLLLLLVGSGFGILLALAGIVLSILGLRGPRRGMAIAGLIISTISFVLLLAVLTLLAIFGFGR